MKVGVLFWGFNDLNFISECCKLLKKKQEIKEFYIQISSNEKTISLIDIFPEEIIRSEYDDLNIFYKWLSKNHKKNIIIIIDIWLLLSKKNFAQVLNHLKDILNEPFQFIICTPKNFHEPVQFPTDKRLSQLAERNAEFFKNVYDFYNLALNCSSPVMLLAYSPYVNFLNFLCNENLFTIKKLGIFNFIPSILNDYSSIFTASTRLVESIENKIAYIAELLQNTKNKKELDLMFYNEIQADFINPNDKKIFNKKKLKGLLINSSIEHYFKFNNKEDSKFLTWLIYLGIIEKYLFSEIVENNSVETVTSLELFSSTLM